MVQKILGAQRDFSAGEVDITLKRADDHPARKAGVRQCANFRILNSNSVQNRSGRRALFPEIGRNEKIVVAPGVFYYLAFGNGTLKIRDTTGAVVASQSGYSWTATTCKTVVYALAPRGSSGIDVVITFAGQIPKIARFTNGTGWTFLDFAFATNGTALAGAVLSHQYSRRDAAGDRRSALSASHRRHRYAGRVHAVFCQRHDRQHDSVSK
jgi:hypothetical protein